MSLYLSAKESFFPSFSKGTAPSCNIRGRMIPFKEFLPRLKNYCLSLGFKKPIVQIPESSPVGHTLSGKHPEMFPAGNDAVIVLTTRVPYEPSWGVYGGLSRPLIHERTDHHPEGTTSGFIAPYLLQYQFAQEHIYLARKEDNQYLITLPADLIESRKEHDGKNLTILLDKIVEVDGDGHFSPLGISDNLISFKISEQFFHLLGENHFSWMSGRGQRIGKFLTDDLFEFAEAKQENGSKSEFAETLLPVMNRIVTSENPQLQAALFHLQNEFSRTVGVVLNTDKQQDSQNLLCIAGLDIDVAAFKGRGKRYFIPWAAYWQQGATQQEDLKQLKQDDLFVALMAQKKHCLV